MPWRAPGDVQPHACLQMRSHACLQVKTLSERASQLERECAELQLQLAQERRQAKDAASAAQNKLMGALRRIQYLVRNMHGALT